MFNTEILNQFSEKYALVTADGTGHKYSDLLLHSDLMAEKIPSRYLVFCICSNTPGSVIGYVSFLLNRSVPLLLSRDLDGDMLRSLISTYSPEFIWMPEDLMIGIKGEIVLNFLGYSLVRLSSEKRFAVHDDLAALLTTSGSTGSPKLVRLTYENLSSNSTSIREYLSLDESERPITSLPMSYSFGLSIINSHLASGSTIILTDKSLMERGFWSLVKSAKVTSLSGVPYSYEILRRLGFSKMDLPHLKTMTQAGGKLGLEINREFAELCIERGIRFFVMYGQTEATARMSYLPPKYSIEKLGSIGHAIPGGEFFLIDENGAAIEKSDRVGELAYKGNNVSMGYATRGRDLIKGDENNGILFTGDLAKRDKNGFFYIEGRKNRYIKIFGNRVNLDEIEGLVRELVTYCACTGIDDKMTIFIEQGDRVMEVRKYVSSRTRLHISSIEVCHIEEIPKSSSGKTLYSELVSR